jgi:hypothetical protein
MLCHAVSMRENGHLRLSKGVRTYTLQEPYPGIRLYKDDHYSALREPYVRGYGSIRLRLLNGYHQMTVKETARTDVFGVLFIEILLSVTLFFLLPGIPESKVIRWNPHNTRSWVLFSTK